MSEDETGARAVTARRQTALHKAMMGRRWNAAREAVFFAELAETANITHAAAQAGMTPASAHNRRRSEPAFASQWLRALEAGYAQLELLMLRQSIEGATRTETVRDGDGAIRQTKTIHGFPHAVAMRLLQSHREEVERFRLMEAMRGGGDEMSAVERIRVEIARVRQRLVDEPAEDGGCDDADDDDRTDVPREG